MADHPPFRKVFDRVASRDEMFALFDRHRDNSAIDPHDGKPYAGEWFEITAKDYHFMLELLPPLFERTGMVGLSGYKAGYVTSVFFAIRIRTRARWFHGFCDLSDKRSPETMRAAIIAHETAAPDSMTREEKLEAIWAATPADLKGLAGGLNPAAWPPADRGKRTLLIHAGGPGMIIKLLEDLSDVEIDELLPDYLKTGRPKGGGGSAPP